MKRVTLLAAALAALVAVVSAGAATTLQVTPVGRLPFPERGYVVDLPKNAAVAQAAVHVTENGRPVGSFSFDPLSSTGLRYGAVLAIDASNSMKGDPYGHAVAAAQRFVDRQGQNEPIGLVAFNGNVETLARPTLDAKKLQAILSHPPAVQEGTRIYDAVGRGVDLLAASRVTTGAIVLLSDGSDIGSQTTLNTAIKRAAERGIRVFTVGLKSGQFDPATLQKIASSTGGAYAEATSTKQLAPIYDALGARLASEYLLQYRSDARPTSQVDVQISIDGVGGTTTAYTAPTPSGLPPFHRSLVTRFLLSPISVLLLALAIAAVIAVALRSLLEQRRSHMVDRVQEYVGPEKPRSDLSEQVLRRTQRARAAGAAQARGWLGRLQTDLEIARIDMTATRVVAYTVGATVLAFILLSLLSPVAALLAFLVPFFAHSQIRRKLNKVRDDFSEQLPPNLQIVASALRSGHSFSGALSMSIEHAHEPSRSELRRAVADEQLGVDMDEAVNRVAVRMASRDLEQVALLAELQRTTGGNAAEVLDTVVGTIRERQDVRRLVKTLTAQGRMAKWILTGLPIVTFIGSYLLQPEVVKPFMSSTGGQIALVFAAFLVAVGSIAIGRIVDIKV